MLITDIKRYNGMSFEIECIFKKIRKIRSRDIIRNKSCCQCNHKNVIFRINYIHLKNRFYAAASTGSGAASVASGAAGGAASSVGLDSKISKCRFNEENQMFNSKYLHIHI